MKKMIWIMIGLGVITSLLTAAATATNGTATNRASGATQPDSRPARQLTTRHLLTLRPKARRTPSAKELSR
jgi:hypothetical protein